MDLENTELIIQYFASIKIELSHTVPHENSFRSRVIVCVIKVNTYHGRNFHTTSLNPLRRIYCSLLYFKTVGSEPLADHG